MGRDGEETREVIELNINISPCEESERSQQHESVAVQIQGQKVFKGTILVERKLRRRSRGRPERAEEEEEDPSHREDGIDERKDNEAVNEEETMFQPENTCPDNTSHQEKGETDCHDPVQSREEEITSRSGKKRKLLVWTPEEEEMLRIGVEKFSKTANKNMPWTKILEVGRSVFHEERTSADLKAKWKKINKTS